MAKKNGVNFDIEEIAQKIVEECWPAVLMLPPPSPELLAKVAQRLELDKKGEKSDRN
jgi:hypothetical protein